jgi:ABC-type multidrug transport system permease subunit
LPLVDDTPHPAQRHAQAIFSWKFDSLGENICVLIWHTHTLMLDLVCFVFRSGFVRSKTKFMKDFSGFQEIIKALKCFYYLAEQF